MLDKRYVNRYPKAIPQEKKRGNDLIFIKNSKRIPMTLKIFIDQNKKEKEGAGWRESQIELHFQDPFIFKFNHS